MSVGAPFRSHVYLIDGLDGPIAFDAGVKGSAQAILDAAGGRLARESIRRLIPLQATSV